MERRASLLVAERWLVLSLLLRAGPYRLPSRSASVPHSVQGVLLGAGEGRAGGVEHREHREREANSSWSTRSRSRIRLCRAHAALSSGLS